MDSITIEKFERLFRGRTDAYGTFAQKGKDLDYDTKKSEVTLGHFRDHLLGKGTLGILPLLDDGTSGWLCLDFDTPNITDVLACRDVFAKYSIPSYVETSKTKGHHLWTFWHSAPAHHLRQVAWAVLAEANADPETEVFPKQDKAGAGSGSRYGNYVNLPYAGDAKPGRRVILDDQNEEMTLQEFLDCVVVNEPEALKRIIPKPRPPLDYRARIVTIHSGRQAWTGGPPACVQAALSQPVDDGHSHNVGFRLAAYWTHTEQLDEEEVWDRLTEWNDSNSPPRSETALRACMKSVSTDHSCTFLRQERVFRDACTWNACPLYSHDKSEKAILVKKREERDADRPSALTMPPDEKALRDAETAMVKRLSEVGFIGTWCKWMCQVTDAPAIYHCLTALAAIAASVGNGVKIRSYGGGDLYPNVWISIIAPSGIYRKSTAIGQAARVLGNQAELSRRLIPSNFTTEALIPHLADEPSGLLLIDELSGFLQAMNKKYQSDTKMLLTSLYSGAPYSMRRAGKDPIKIADIATTILAASTKDNLEKELSQADFANGFLVRMLFIHGEVKEPWKDYLKDRLIDNETPTKLGTALRMFSKYNGVAEFADEAVYARFNTWMRRFYDDFEKAGRTDDTSGLISRAQDLVFKYAMILQIAASLNDTDGVSSWGRIEMYILDIAIDFVEWAIQSQLRLMSKFAFTGSGRSRQRIVGYIAKRGKVYRSELVKWASMTARELDGILESASEALMIQEFVEESSGRGPQKRFYMPYGSELQKGDDAA